jgi:hypothetical protein
MSARDEICRYLVPSFGDREGAVVADELLAALAAAGFVVEQGWQPIETARTDGTRIIAWFPPCAQLPNGGWHEMQWYDGWHHPFFVEPTHWMPGPQPPAALEPRE